MTNSIGKLLTLAELKAMDNKPIIIKSLPEWLTVDRECEEEKLTRILHLIRGKIIPSVIDLPLMWTEANYGKYWAAYDYPKDPDPKDNTAKPLTLAELKTMDNKPIVIESLPKWLTVDRECEKEKLTRILHLLKGKIIPSVIDIPLMWTEANYGEYWIAYDRQKVS
jgi:hypothetical protein